jgi:hypothetical protein
VATPVRIWLRVVHIRNEGKTIRRRIKIMNYSHNRENYGSID